MKVDAALTTTDLGAVGAAATQIEATGYDGIFTFEGQHDPFFPLLLAAEHTERVQLTTAVAIAFARNPMTLAQTAYDLQLASHGRFRLGLGTQIKPHIEKRFSMPWSQPVERMRELVLAIRAIWATWHEGTPLDFRGEFYRHTLMTPFFNPGPSPYGLPTHLPGRRRPAHDRDGRRGRRRIHRAPVRYRAVVARADDSRARAGCRRARADRSPTSRSRSRSWPSWPTPTRRSTRGRAAMRPRLAFYGSTPAYKVILDVHGWGDLQPELNRLSKTGDWATMSALITDEMIDAFSVQGTTRRHRRDRARALRRPRAAHLVRHQRATRSRPRERVDRRYPRN